jgi:hypothetical protein
MNISCEAFCKGLFLMNPPDTFYCPTCREPGDSVMDERIDKPDGSGVYKTVRVEFGYEPAGRRYSETAIVDIPELKTGGEYVMRCVTVKTANRALKLGEFAICALNSGIKDGSAQETVLNLDADDATWSISLNKLNTLLEERERRLENALH